MPAVAVSYLSCTPYSTGGKGPPKDKPKEERRRLTSSCLCLHAYQTVVHGLLKKTDHALLHALQF